MQAGDDFGVQGAVGLFGGLLYLGAEGWRHARVSIDLVGPDSPTLAELLTGLRGWLGIAPAPILRIPAFLAWPFVLLADLVGWLGWRSPMRSTAMRQLKAGITGDGEATVFEGAALIAMYVTLGAFAWLD